MIFVQFLGFLFPSSEVVMFDQPVNMVDVSLRMSNLRSHLYRERKKTNLGWLGIHFLCLIYNIYIYIYIYLMYII